MSRVPNIQPSWKRIEAPEGYELEMDISRLGGGFRHRLLPRGEWRSGDIPDNPALEDIIGGESVIVRTRWYDMRAHVAFWKVLRRLR